MKYPKILLVLLVVGFSFVGCSGDDTIETTNNIEDTTKDKEVIEVIQDEDEKKDETQTSKENEQEEPIEQEEVKEEELAEGMAINPLTGLPIIKEAVEHRPVAVTINNKYSSLPQSGISGADIIYETLVEGGITRLIAVFQDVDSIEKLGSIRSARRYFLDFALDLDAIYIHYGQDPLLSSVHQELGDANLNGLSYLDTIMCWRDNTRYAPHNVYTSGDKIMAAWDTVGYRKEKKENYPMAFDFLEDEEVIEGTGQALKVSIPYSHYITGEFIYNDEAGKYARYQFNEEHIDENTGEILTTKNIIIQYTNMYQRPGDTDGRLNMDLIGSGKGYYISNGRMSEMTWEKTGQYEPTQYYGNNGDKLKINKGNTWICVVPLGTEVAFE